MLSAYSFYCKECFCEGSKASRGFLFLETYFATTSKGVPLAQLLQSWSFLSFLLLTSMPVCLNTPLCSHSGNCPTGTDVGRGSDGRIPSARTGLKLRELIRQQRDHCLSLGLVQFPDLLSRWKTAETGRGLPVQPFMAGRRFSLEQHFCQYKLQMNFFLIAVYRS